MDNFKFSYLSELHLTLRRWRPVLSIWRIRCALIACSAIFVTVGDWFMRFKREACGHHLCVGCWVPSSDGEPSECPTPLIPMQWESQWLYLFGESINRCWPVWAHLLGHFHWHSKPASLANTLSLNCIIDSSSLWDWESIQVYCL